MTTTESDILIIGTGMSGLMAATTLPADKQITILDKGRSVGGRLATRRIGQGRADHGAQFFTVRDEGFAAQVDPWISEGLVFRWSKGWGDGSADAAPPDGYPRYAVSGGMNAMAKRLAADLEQRGDIDIRTGVLVTAIARDGDGWQAIDQDGTLYSAATLIITSPVPQSLALFDAGGTSLSTDDRFALDRINYAPCVCGIAWIEGETTLPDPGAVQRTDAPISWIADNRRKGISPEATVITIHANADLSRAIYDEPDDIIAPIFDEVIASTMTPGSSIKQLEIKRWRYALPLVLHPDRYLKAADLPPLYFGGDAFGGPRVEGAALSGMAIGRAIARLWNR